MAPFPPGTTFAEQAERLGHLEERRAAATARIAELEALPVEAPPPPPPLETPNGTARTEGPERRRWWQRSLDWG